MFLLILLIFNGTIIYVVYEEVNIDIKSKFSEKPKITKKKSKNIYSVDSNYVNSINFHQYAIKKLKQVDIEKIYEATYDVLKARNEKTDGDTIEAYVIKLLASKEIIEGGTYYEKK